MGIPVKLNAHSERKPDGIPFGLCVLLRRNPPTERIRHRRSSVRLSGPFVGEARTAGRNNKSTRGRITPRLEVALRHGPLSNPVDGEFIYAERVFSCGDLLERVYSFEQKDQLVMVHVAGARSVANVDA